jgi:glutamine---fructose-6-phosphate transaminase (isomerizing)
VERGQFTRDEMFSQSIAWTAALAEVEAIKQQIAAVDFSQCQQVIFTGCGSSYYLSLSAATLFQNVTGVCAKAVPAGELLLNPSGFYRGRDNYLFAFSRSGATTEVVESVKAFRANHAGPIFSTSVRGNTPLADASDFYLAIKEGEEESIAQTRAFTTMHVAIAAIAMLAAGRPDYFDEMKRLPDIAESLLTRYESYAREIGEDLNVDRFYFLGSGERYGLACEGNLKMKEMTITHTEPFHFLEFRHGPISMVTENTVIVGLLSESHRNYEEKVLDDARGLGAQVVAVAERAADITFESALSECVRNTLYLPLLQVMAFYRSLKKGLDPDKPRNLNSVVYLV